MATSEEYAKMSDSEKKKEDWMNSKWRPMMGWSYMLTCICDFVLFPILWSLIQVIGGGEVKMQWNPITLMGAGLYHVAMGAVLGLAAWGRTQEKMAGANNGGLGTAAPSVPTSFASTPSSTPAPSFSSSPAPSFGGAKSFGASSPAAEVEETTATPSGNIPRPMPMIKRPGA
jgi:hypothetical protein